MPVTGFTVPGRRAALVGLTAPRSRAACRPGCGDLVLIWIHRLKSRASVRVAWFHGTPITQQNRNHRSRSFAYEYCVAAGRPDA